MTDTTERHAGASALVRLVGKGFRQAKLIAVYTIGGLLAVAILSTLMGGSNAAVGLAVLVVVGAELGLRRYEKKKASQFGDTARGTEVQDHTQGGGQ
jgi:hypothetical protein